MLLLTKWLTLNCVFQQKLTLESIQIAILQVLLLVLPETLSALLLSRCIQLLYYPGWPQLPMSFWCKTWPSSVPCYAPLKQQILSTYRTLLEVEALPSPKPVTPHTQLIVMPWVMGAEGQALWMVPEASLLKWKPYLHIEPNPDPLLPSTYKMHLPSSFCFQV